MVKFLSLDGNPGQVKKLKTAFLLRALLAISFVLITSRLPPFVFIYLQEEREIKSYRENISHTKMSYSFLNLLPANYFL